MKEERMIKKLNVLSKIKKEGIEINRKVFSKYKDCKECSGTLYKDDGSVCNCKSKHILDVNLKKCNVLNDTEINLQFFRDNFFEMEVRLYKNLMTPNKKVKGIEFLIKYIKLYICTFDNRLKDGRGFMICGSIGSGKTATAIYIIRQLCLKSYERQFQGLKPYSCFFMEVISLMDVISDSWDKESITNYESKLKLNMISNVDFLVLDDFGTEYSKNYEWIMNVFLKFLKTRYNKNLPTVITSNFKPEALLEKFSGEIFPRLNSILSERFEVLVIDNEDDIRPRISNRRSLMTDMLKEREHES